MGGHGEEDAVRLDNANGNPHKSCGLCAKLSSTMARSHTAFLRAHPVFTVEDFDQHLKSRGEPGERTRERLLDYYLNARRIVRVRRGLYVSVPDEDDADHPTVDPYLVASRVTPDAVVAYHSALSFFDRAYSVRSEVTYVAGRPRAPFVFTGTTYRGTRFPASLLEAGQEHFAVSMRERDGLPVRVASLERTLVDVLDRPSLSGSWEEIWRSLAAVEFFDLDVVLDYLQLLDNATTAAKVGFFLEQHAEALMVDEAHLKALRAMRPSHPHYLERGQREGGRLIPEWNLIVPEEILEQTWAEIP